MRPSTWPRSNLSCAFAARACFHKVFFSTRPHQAPRNNSELSECAQKHFAVQIEGMQRGLPTAPGCHQIPRSRRPRECGRQILRSYGGLVGHRKCNHRCVHFHVIENHALAEISGPVLPGPPKLARNEARMAHAGNRKRGSVACKYFLHDPVGIPG